MRITAAYTTDNWDWLKQKFMRVIICNTTDHGGGAANAALRLHAALSSQHVESLVAVMEKTQERPGVHALSSRLRKTLQPFLRQMERAPLLLYPHRDRHSLFSPSWRPSLVHHTLEAQNPDIIHLHWIEDSFLPLYSLARLPRPVVWTLHDVWALTGGCHLFKKCQHYRTGCHDCPQLNSKSRYNLASFLFAAKRHAYHRVRPTIIAPSRYMAELARQSSLLGTCRIEHIPNTLDTEVFRPIDKATARKLLRLPSADFIIAFGAVNANSDLNKGCDLLVGALQELMRLGRKDISCAVFGGYAAPRNFPLPLHNLGVLRDDTSLALTYAAADVFVCPSRDENLPYTVMESLACGTPVVAFDIGGMADLVEQGKTGFLVPPYDSGEMAAQLAALVDAIPLRQTMGEAARKKILAEYAPAIIALRHKRLYQELLNP